MFLSLKKKITSIAEPVIDVGGSNFPESKNMDKVVVFTSQVSGDVQGLDLESADDFTVVP